MAHALTQLVASIRRLTPGRWVALVAIAASLTAVSLLPSVSRPTNREASTATTESRRASLMNWVAARARVRAQMASARVTALARAGAPGSLVVIHDSTVDRRAWALLDTVTQRQAASLGTPSPDSRVVVVFLADTAWGSGRYTLLPAITDGRTCISVVVLHAGRTGVATESAARTAHRLTGGTLGPCAFVRAFGLPGAAARQILAENPVFALDPDWTRYRGTRAIARTARDSILARSFLSESRWHWRWTVNERACASGRLQSCRAAMRDTVAREQHPAPAAGVISSHQTTWSRWGTTNLLASMVQQHGTSAFARFWRADGSPEDAFLAATGRPIEEFAHRYWTEIVGPRYAGPGIPRGSALLAVVTALAFVGAAVALAPRRVAR